MLAQTTPRYLIVNNNHPEGNIATFFKLANDGTFVGHQKVQTGGKGIAEPTELFNPSFPGVATFHSAAQDCVFVADAGTSDIAAIDSNLKVVGRFQGGRSDKNNFTGIALAINKNFLYAAFSGKMNSTRGGTLASFAIHPGCTLHFLGSVPAVGTGYRSAFVRYPITLAAHAKILIVAYGDGSIESFHFSNGLAQSNGDLQNSSAALMQVGQPGSVDITKDARFAVFGDATGCSGIRTGNVIGGGSVEVADISSGKLSQPTVVYSFADYGSVFARLSPDESLVYISGTGVAGATFFDQNNGSRLDKLLRHCPQESVRRENARMVVPGEPGVR